MSARDDLVAAMGKCWIVEPEDETGSLEWLVIAGVRFAGVELEMQRKDYTGPDEWGWTIYRLGRGHHKLTDCPPDKWKERNAWASGYADTREEAKAAAVQAVADWLHPVMQALLALLDAEPVAWGAKMPPEFGGGIEVYRADTWDKLRTGVEELCIGKPFALYARPEASDD